LFFYLQHVEKSLHLGERTWNVKRDKGISSDTGQGSDFFSGNKLRI